MIRVMERVVANSPGFDKGNIRAPAAGLYYYFLTRYLSLSIEVDTLAYSLGVTSSVISKWSTLASRADNN
jgi:hypothetical protein